MAAKSKFESRKLMELAIEVMRQSVPEPQKDGKASPKVGAVLVKPDGKIETAYRGELRHGDHAEFTLLERKNRGNKLDGSILFATLEPCAPDSRNHPKLGCAERICLARIKEVWVGIQDPDPKVARKGIEHLKNRRVPGISGHLSGHYVRVSARTCPPGGVYGHEQSLGARQLSRQSVARRICAHAGPENHDNNPDRLAGLADKFAANGLSRQEPRHIGAIRQGRQA